ncbi:hypothetical protein B0H15DRAFT_949758 [Mycena belliarum]|uniref:Uncharacterized protein n=1 Tax=Mycena belliarum TaxID=1033014 RepID=A0AAD6XLT7_9AGAR|nr:hypothetical protein B0H15DRAFT_949758 [Mycena belliae]
MDNPGAVIVIITASSLLLLTLVGLIVWFLRIRQRRRRYLERGIRWQFPPSPPAPVLPFVAGNHTSPRLSILPATDAQLRVAGASRTAKTNLSRFSWFVSEDKSTSTHDYYKDPVDALESDQPVSLDYPEPVVIRAATHSGPMAF